MKENQRPSRLFVVVLTSLVGILIIIVCLLWFKSKNKGELLSAIVAPSEFSHRSEPLRLSELIEELQIVHLDSEDPDALVGQYAAPTLSDSYIGIKSSEPNKPFSVYDRASGRFLRSIGDIGRGPGEYTGLHDWVIDEPQDRIYLVPFARSTILEYDLSGNYIGTIQVPEMANSQRKMKIEVRDSVITAFMLPLAGDTAIVYTFSKSGKVIASTPNILLGAENFNAEMYVNKDSTTTGYMSTAVPTYYHFDHSTNSLRAVFDIDTTAGGTDDEWNPEVYESSLYTLVRILFYPRGDGTKQKDYWLVTDRRTGERFSGYLVNDFLGGIETINGSHPDKFYRNHYFTFENGYYLETIPAVVLKRLLEEALKENEMTPEVREHVETLNDSFTEDDNHFLLYGRLKQ